MPADKQGGAKTGRRRRGRAGRLDDHWARHPRVKRGGVHAPQRAPASLRRTEAGGGCGRRTINIMRRRRRTGSADSRNTLPPNERPPPLRPVDPARHGAKRGVVRVLAPRLPPQLPGACEPQQLGRRRGAGCERSSSIPWW